MKKRAVIFGLDGSIECGQSRRELALTLRGGYDFLKVQAQFGYSYNLTNSNFKQDEEILSIGVVYTFRRR